MFDETSFFVLNEENGEYVMKRISPGNGCYENVITLAELQEKFVSLDEVLDTSRYVGMFADKYQIYKAFVLYEILIGREKRYIVLMNSKISICEEQHVSNFVSCDVDTFSAFKDKEYVKSYIEKQILGTIRKDKLRNRKIK